MLIKFEKDYIFEKLYKNNYIGNKKRETIVIDQKRNDAIYMCLGRTMGIKQMFLLSCYNVCHDKYLFGEMLRTR